MPDLLDSLVTAGRLSDKEVFHLLKGEYANLNKLKANRKLICLFPNCTSIGVERSHLFSQGFLRQISEEGKVISKNFLPIISKNTVRYTIEDLGIGEAMTFPGFCKTCEQRFEFEKRLKFSVPKDYLLQLFRTVCYEKRILEIEIESNVSLINKFRSVTTRRLQALLHGSGMDLKSFSGANGIEQFLERRNKLLATRLNYVDKLYKNLISGIEAKLSLTVLSLQIPINLRFFAGYVGSCRIQTNRKHLKTDIVINVHPTQKNYTEVFLIDFKNKIKTQHFEVLNLQEQIAFLGEILLVSNNWVMNRSYWELLPDKAKVTLLEAKNVSYSDHQKQKSA